MTATPKPASAIIDATQHLFSPAVEVVGVDEQNLEVEARRVEVGARLGRSIPKADPR